jgi:curved DNA-binding protein CbpA
MQELNKVFEILGNENLRKRYDVGEVNPTDFDFEVEKATAGLRAEMEKIKEMIKILEEDRERWREMGRKIDA